MFDRDTLAQVSQGRILAQVRELAARVEHADQLARCRDGQVQCEQAAVQASLAERRWSALVSGGRFDPLALQYYASEQAAADSGYREAKDLLERAEADLQQKRERFARAQSLNSHLSSTERRVCRKLMFERDARQAESASVALPRTQGRVP